MEFEEKVRAVARGRGEGGGYEPTVRLTQPQCGDLCSRRSTTPGSG